jgi:hypothetical protein
MSLDCIEKRPRWHQAYRANFTYLGGYVCGHTDTLNVVRHTASPTCISIIGGASTSWTVDTERDLTFNFLSADLIGDRAHLVRVNRHADLAIGALAGLTGTDCCKAACRHN